MFDENNPIRPQDPEIRSQDPETPAETPAESCPGGKSGMGGAGGDRLLVYP